MKPISDDDQKLQEACLQLAKTVVWDLNFVDLDAIQSRSEEFYKESLIYLKNNPEIDIKVITRSIHYIRQVHALPVGPNDAYWLHEVLSILLEIVYPNVNLEGEAKQFLSDMIEGISTLI